MITIFTEVRISGKIANKKTVEISNSKIIYLSRKNVRNIYVCMNECL